jgi:hypothetical protein
VAHNWVVSWEVEYTNEFERWWDGLTEEEQDKIDSAVGLLERLGPNLDFPHSSGVNSRQKHMRELRVQIHGNPFRILYAFDERRAAMLLIGGDKTGEKRWYDMHIPIAERLYDEHVAELERLRVAEEAKKGEKNNG